jgi:acetyl esterase/lipase
VVAPKFNPNKSIDEIRESMESLVKYAKLPPDTQIEKITIGGILSEWLYPKESHEDRAILYLHGGGYNVCSLNTWILHGNLK